MPRSETSWQYRSSTKYSSAPTPKKEAISACVVAHSGSSAFFNGPRVRGCSACSMSSACARAHSCHAARSFGAWRRGSERDESSKSWRDLRGSAARIAAARASSSADCLLLGRGRSYCTSPVARCRYIGMPETGSSSLIQPFGSFSAFCCTTTAGGGAAAAAFGTRAAAPLGTTTTRSCGCPGFGAGATARSEAVFCSGGSAAGAPARCWPRAARGNVASSEARRPCTSPGRRCNPAARSR